MAPKVTILDGLPIGRRAILRIEGELWMAFPLPKIARLHGHASRTYGIARTAQQRLTRVVEQRPDLYPLLAPTLTTLARAESIPTWCHDRPELKVTRTVNWRKHIRQWAKENQATRATISNCGPVKELSIDSIITRIRTVHGTFTPLGVHHDDTDGALVLAFPDGRIAARITQPAATPS